MTLNVCACAWAAGGARTVSKKMKAIAAGGAAKRGCKLNVSDGRNMCIPPSRLKVAGVLSVAETLVRTSRERRLAKLATNRILAEKLYPRHLIWHHLNTKKY